MAQSFKRDIAQLADSLSVFTPEEKTSRANDANDLVTVPDVEGMGAKDAVFILKKRGLDVSLQGTGEVKSQSIPSGTPIIKGQKIKLILE
jgi:cell division protein FtsI (penicillin-binding protein 3)